MSNLKYAKPITVEVFGLRISTNPVINISVSGLEWLDTKFGSILVKATHNRKVFAMGAIHKDHTGRAFYVLLNPFKELEKHIKSDYIIDERDPKNYVFTKIQKAKKTSTNDAKDKLLKLVYSLKLGTEYKPYTDIKITIKESDQYTWDLL